MTNRSDQGAINLRESFLGEQRGIAKVFWPGLNVLSRAGTRTSNALHLFSSVLENGIRQDAVFHDQLRYTPGVNGLFSGKPLGQHDAQHTLMNLGLKRRIIDRVAEPEPELIIALRGLEVK